VKTRELIGLVLSVAAVAIAPFGYWLSLGWLLVSLALAIPGFTLLFTERNIKKYDPSVAPDADILPGSAGGLRGFHVSRALDSFPDASDGD